MEFSKWFVRLNWIALVLIFLVVIAGSLVRITGSGMGCPDWPKCFGEWIPPTNDANLPDNYKDIYSEKRGKKLEKFTSFLKKIGLDETAKKLENDPSILIEQDFNARKTWTEYGNRLVGFLSGNALLIAFIWMIVRYRKNRKLLLIAAVNLVILVVQAWFGSIVVASNLVPWTITVHMLLALVIIGLQLYILRMISPSQRKNLLLPKATRILMFVIFAITFYQMFLGTQVREEIDTLTKLGYSQEQWIEMIGMPFYIHRSFSWLVLLLLIYIFYINEKNERYVPIRWLFGLLAVELISGVLLAHMDMPGLVRTLHLLFASAMFGILVMILFRSKPANLQKV
ncbi:MAG: heme A synthase [Bacteroidetes bacterium]|nr:MAG: heme A synthase [Bacteroidota bacterium]